MMKMKVNRKPVRIIAAVTLLVFAAGLTTGCGEDPEGRARQSGKEIWFEETVHDFGEIPRDGDGTCTFTFKNLGNEPIVINRVRSSCGCTVPSWPREPVEPGETGKISVRYNTALTGTFMKSVYVYVTASNSPVKLQIKGKVVPPEKIMSGIPAQKTY